MNTDQIKNENTPLLGAVIAGGIASACCIGPVMMVALGLGSASAFIALEPYRPIFAAITLALIGRAGWRYWQGRKTCTANACPPKKPVLLWALSGFALLLLISPSLLPYLVK